MPEMPSFAELAAATDPPLDLLALAVGAEFRDVDAIGAVVRLDGLGVELSDAVGRTSGTPEAQSLACGELLGVEHGFAGDREHYDDPANSMLDGVLSTRRGLPILLSVVYIEVARRAGVAIAGVGLPGHFGAEPPLLLDPFAGGEAVEADVLRLGVRPWRPHEIAMRMLNNLVAAYQRRGDVSAAMRAAGMRLALPSESESRPILEAELRAMQARLN